MGKALVVEVKESVGELKQLYRQLSPSKQKRIQLLLLMQKGKHQSKDSLAQALGVSGQSVHTWRRNYLKGGLSLLLEDSRGGFKQATILPTIKEQLDKCLSAPTQGFKSYKEVQQWLKESFGIEMKYSALYQFLKRSFAVKLKVGRKMHIQKSPAAEAVFKNALPQTFQQVKQNSTPTTYASFNLYFEDESRFGLLTRQKRVRLKEG